MSCLPLHPWRRHWLGHAAAAVGLSLMAAPVAAQANVLTLESALETAEKHAPELRQAAATSEAARARITIARAPLLPQITGTASYARGTTNGVGPMQTRTSLDTRDSFAAGLRATQLIYDFGQAWNSKEAARQNAFAQEQTERATQLEIAFNVRNAFLTAAADRALTDVALATLANQERHRGQIQGFVEVGTRPPIDLAQARTDVANAHLAVLRAQNAYAGAKAELSRAMGVTTGQDYEVSAALPPAEEGEDSTIELLMQRAEKDRPEFAALSGQMRAEQATLRSIEGQYGPSLNLVGTADENGYRLSSMATNLSAGVTLNWPIFQGGVTNGRVDEARALLAGINAQLEALRADLRLGLTQAVLSVNAAQATLVAAAELVGLAQERLALAEGRYATGVGNSIELGDAELALRDAQTQHVSAEYDLALARALLRRSLGRR
jgi:outer membrane protein